jgi:hypothetical protein
VYLLGRVWLRYKSTLEKVGRLMMKEYFIMIVSFNTLNICYSAGLQFTYGKEQLILNMAVTVACLCLPLAAIMMLLFDRKFEDYGEFKSHFKTIDSLKYNFFAITILYRSVLGFCLSQLNEIEEATISNFFIGLLFTVYIIGDKPYVRAYQNWRSSIVQIGCLSGLFVAMFYRSMKSTATIVTRTSIL